MARYSISYVGHPLPILGEKLILRYISGKRPKKVRLSDEEYIRRDQKLKKSLLRFVRYEELNAVYSYDPKPGYTPEYTYEDKSAHKPEKSPVLYPPLPSEIHYSKPVGVCRINEIRTEVRTLLQKYCGKAKYKLSSKKEQDIIYISLCCVLDSKYSGLELVVAYRILDTMLK